jgi:hypothetical protein
MTEERLPTDDLRELAEEVMEEKTNEVGNEAQSRELWDVPTEDAATLADAQEDDH